MSANSKIAELPWHLTPEIYFRNCAFKIRTFNRALIMTYLAAALRATMMTEMAAGVIPSIREV